MGARPRLALVTGASSGLGLDFARILAREGWDLVVSARDRDRLQALADALERERGTRIVVAAHDLSTPGGVQALVSSVEREGRPVDLLINNAGSGLLAPYPDTDPAAEAAMIRLNVEALVTLTRAVLPAMLARGSGRILNVGSVASFMSGPGMTTYYATKAFVLSYSDALAEELRGTGVSVTCLCPGPTKTEFLSRAGASGRVFDGPTAMTSAAVAEAGVAGALAGRRRVVPGLANKVSVWAAKVLPRDLMTSMVARIQRSRS